MIQINQLKLPVGHTEAQLENKLASVLRVDRSKIKRWRVIRRSIDARDKSDLRFVYSVEAEVAGEKGILKKSRNANITEAVPVRYRFPKAGEREMVHPPVVVGSGPAGLFCAWMLAKHGYRPILLERGDSASERQKKVEEYWEKGQLDPESNVQFGEGGAGTFSDGKLNTGVHDKLGRNHEVLKIFVQAGAPEDILWDNKPHLGTDLLVQIVEKMRTQIISWGGKVQFRTKVTDLLIEEGQIKGVKIENGKTIASEAVILAIGHSARDTFRMLAEKPLELSAKSFAVGFRVQHEQKMINDLLYGEDAPEFLGAAPYKVTKTVSEGRGVYSFCMCPGGYIVNASSEEGRTAVNGMSYHDRASGYANSAIVVQVGPEDFAPYAREEVPEVLNGLLFQQAIEENAFKAGQGKIPVQRFADFCKNQAGQAGIMEPCTRGQVQYANVREILPEELSNSIEKGMYAFDQKLPGFADDEVLMMGVESRTSSPIRIQRNEHFESAVRGLYPCGEGAGYAGGITSAAIDGLKVAEEIAAKYKQFT